MARTTPVVSRAHRQKDGAKPLLAGSFQCTSDLLPSHHLCEVLFWAGSSAPRSNLQTHPSVHCSRMGLGLCKHHPSLAADSVDGSANRGTRGRLEEEELGVPDGHSAFRERQWLAPADRSLCPS